MRLPQSTPAIQQNDGVGHQKQPCGTPLVLMAFGSHLYRFKTSLVRGRLAIVFDLEALGTLADDSKVCAIMHVESCEHTVLFEPKFPRTEGILRCGLESSVPGPHPE